MLYLGLLRVAFLSGRMLKHSTRFHSASWWQIPCELILGTSPPPTPLNTHSPGICSHSFSFCHNDHYDYSSVHTTFWFVERLLVSVHSLLLHRGMTILFGQFGIFIVEYCWYNLQSKMGTPQSVLDLPLLRAFLSFDLHCAQVSPVTGFAWLKVIKRVSS